MQLYKPFSEHPSKWGQQDWSHTLYLIVVDKGTQIMKKNLTRGFLESTPDLRHQHTPGHEDWYGAMVESLGFQDKTSHV